MGFWIKTKEEKEEQNIKSSCFVGYLQQNVGQFIKGTGVNIKLDPERRVLVIKENMIFKKDALEVTLPYERIKGFSVENEVTLAKSGSAIGGAIVGGLLAGGVGALVGAGSTRGKTNVKWIAILSYEDKNGDNQEIVFLDSNEGKNKSLLTSQFENTINKMIINQSGNVTEL